LSTFDTTFLFFYAAGLYVLGNIEDRLAMRIVMPAGMIGAAVMIFLMALMGMIDKGILWPYYGFWALNGVFQAVVWPGTVCVIGHWFQKRVRGVVMGTFAASANAGDLLGTATFAIVSMAAGAPWYIVTLVTSITMAAIAI
jgi:OPA family glycerol-3-phosphate transporter-like MFS transporter 1/2